MKFYIADAFTETLFGGNPAGVVILPRGGEWPSEKTMLKTAAELRYSETVFVEELGANSFRFRYFTPAAEVELCGHATIAAFYALMESGRVNPGGICDFHTLAGNLKAEISDAGVLMDMGEARVFGAIEEEAKLDELYGIMGVKAEIPERNGKKLYPELVSTGLADIMMPLKDLESLNALAPDMKALSKLSEDYNVTGVHAFTVNAPDGHIHCRNFAPLYGIDEEAATGTSNGALSYYLYKRGMIAPGRDNLFVQGEAMGRPSRISSRLTERQGPGPRIQVGGKAVILAGGEINI